MNRKQEISLRVYIVFTCIVVFALVIIGKIFFIQFSEGDKLRELSKKTHIKEEKLTSERGNIYTEDGTLLVSSSPSFDLRWDLKVVPADTLKKYINDISKGLATILKSNNADLLRNKILAAHKKNDRYFLIAKGAQYYEYQQIRELPILSKKKNKGGFIVESKSQRDNPYKILAYRTLGLWRENVPNVGLEQFYNDTLKGTEGSWVLRKSTGNVWIPINDMVIDPVNGKDIVSTIDINIQEVTEHALMESLTKHGCQFGTAIVMETHTGKIKAIANLGRQEDGSYWEDYNYALTLSEPGSTFKLMSLFALLEDDYVKITDQVNVEGGIKVFGKQRVRDDHTGMGTVTIEKAFASSSNVAFAKLINQYYSKDPMKYIKHLQDLHLNQKTGIDLAEKVTPVIKTVKSKSWNSVTSLPWIAYGYESLITPMHTLMVYNAVANNGKMMKPYLVSEIQENGMTVKHIEPTVLVDQIGKKETITQLRQAMEAVVDKGTAKTVKSKLYRSGGKTGTAQVADVGIKYSDGVKQGSFVGYFPAENPKYTVMVLVRSVPKGAYYGAVVAAPVFKTIADKLYASHIGGWAPPVAEYGKHKQVVVKDGNSEDINTVLQALGLGSVSVQADGFVRQIENASSSKQFQTQPLERGKVPNVVGMGLKDAVYMLEIAGLNVVTTGFGKVISQSLLPQTIIQKGQNIQIQLN